jgi:hypothetical protein
MPNAWVEHTRAFAKKNGISYGCAISDPKNKESYHKQKSRNSKQTRTPKQETTGMGAEDINVAEKPKPKKTEPKKTEPKKSKETADINTSTVLQNLGYDYRVISQIDTLTGDMKKAPSKTFQERINKVMKLTNHNKYADFDSMTDKQEEDFYAWEEDLEISFSVMKDIADDWGISLKFDDDDKLISARYKDSDETQPRWFSKYLKSIKSRGD